MKLTSHFMIMGQKLDINYKNYCIERVYFRLQTSDFRLQTLDVGFLLPNYTIFNANI